MDERDLDRGWETVRHYFGGEDRARRYLELGAEAYLRGQLGDSGAAYDPLDGGAVLLYGMSPERWYTLDYGKAGPRRDAVMRGP